MNKIIILKMELALGWSSSSYHTHRADKRLVHCIEALYAVEDRTQIEHHTSKVNDVVDVGTRHFNESEVSVADVEGKKEDG